MKRDGVKVLIVALFMLLLSGCQNGMEPNTANGDIKTRCINGVLYYFFKEAAGNLGYGFMSPVYDNQTKEVVLCTEVPNGFTIQ